MVGSWLRPGCWRVQCGEVMVEARVWERMECGFVIV